MAWLNRRLLVSIAVAGVTALTVAMVLVGVLLQAAMDAVSSLAHKPTQVTAMRAYVAARQCNFAGDPKLGTAYLIAIAATTTFDPVQLSFGGYRNPFGQTSEIPPDIARTVDRSALQKGGQTYTELGLTGPDLRPEEWTTLVGDHLVVGERGIGFLLISPSSWRQWVNEVPGGSPGTLDPYKPGDSMRVLACHLLRLEAQFGGGVEHAVDAIQSLGDGALQFADQAAHALQLVASRLPGDLANPLALAQDAAVVVGDLAQSMAGLLASGLSKGQALLARVYQEMSIGLTAASGVGLGVGIGVGPPIVGGGPVPPLSFGMRAIPLPDFPPDIDAHVNAGIGFRNQCVYGAEATWWVTHARDPSWPSRVGPSGSYARQMEGTARAAGYTVVGYPVAGSMVVYGAGGPRGSWPNDDAGHIATVVAVASDRYEVIEQNVINSQSWGAPHWGTFDLRVSPWPDDHVLGFIVTPPGVPFTP